MLAGSFLTLIVVAAVLVLGGQVLAQQDTSEDTPEPATQQVEEPETQDEPENRHHVFSFGDDGLHGEIEIWLDQEPGLGLLFQMDEDLPDFFAQELDLLLTHGEELAQILEENDLTHRDLFKLQQFFSDEEYDPVERLAELLGITPEELVEAVMDGQSLAEIAEANGVERQELVDAIVVEAQAKLDQAVAAEDLTAEQAAALLDWFQGVVEMVVDESTMFFHDMDFPRIAPGFGLRLEDMDWPEFGLRGFTFSDPLVVAAETIGITRDELMQALVEGQSLDEIAEEHGVDPHDVQQAMTEAMQQELGDLQVFPHIEWGNIFDGEFEIPDLPFDKDWEEFGLPWMEFWECCPCDETESGE
jgi:uncharacterized protein (DUF433 family)